MAALLKDALKPNLVQTLEHTPALIHGGPFANIAHGCNSVTATRMALKLGDYAITEAGFGADLGAEKFLDIKCRMAGLKPDAVVVVATVRALKHHGGAPKNGAGPERIWRPWSGDCPTCSSMWTTSQTYSACPAWWPSTRFPTDTAAELKLVEEKCRELGVERGPQRGVGQGRRGRHCPGGGGRPAVRAARSDFRYCYALERSIEEKLETICRRIYRADGVVLTPAAQKQARQLTELGFGELPICMAKTQYSFSDDPTLLGAPRGFTVTVRNLKVSAGAGFLVALTGDIMTMPGLPKVPAAERIDVDENGRISGLF